MANCIWLGTTSGDYGVTTNWSTGTVPTTSDNVFIPLSATNNITASLDQHTVAIASFTTEPGSAVLIGSSAGYLRIKPAAASLAGEGLAYIDFSAASVSPQILATAQPPTSTGTYGLYLIGSALGTVSVVSGSVGIAVNPGETATVTNLQVVGRGGSVSVGSGCTLTTVGVNTGNATLNCAVTTANVFNGWLWTQGSGVVTTANVFGGTLYTESSGTVGAIVINGGLVDLTESGISRTITDLTLNPGGKLTYDPNVVTITNNLAPAYPIKLSASAG